jgi:hypothetical protein
VKITIKIEDPDRGEGYSIKRGVESDLSLDGLRDAAETFLESLNPQAALPLDLPKSKAGK